MKMLKVKKARMPHPPKLKMPKGPGARRKKRLNVGKALST